MFFFTYLRRELRRRMGRTVLTVLGLGVGVAMVVAITAVSNGLDDAQKQVLNPLASVGTDLLVTRPVQDSGTQNGQGTQQASPPSTDQAANGQTSNGQPEGGRFGLGRQGGGPGGSGGLSPEDEQALVQENSSVLTDLSKLGNPGDHFVHDFFLPATQLTFPDSEAQTIADLPGVATVSQGLTLVAQHQEGTVPQIVAQVQTGGDQVQVDQQIDPPTPEEQAQIQACIQANGGFAGGGGGNGGAAQANGTGDGGGRGPGGRFGGVLAQCLPERLQRFRGTVQTPQRTITQALNPPQTDITTESYSIAGVDLSQPDVGLITPAQITGGTFFTGATDAHQAVLAQAYAQRKNLGVGDTLDLNGTTFTVVGLAEPPLGGSAADVYLSLTDLQTLSNRAGRTNVLLVRATNASDVGALTTAIQDAFPGATVTSAAQLSDQISGSLVDASNLANRLGSVVAVVVLIAAFCIAALLTLSSVAKRVRELGTLKAIGWRQSLVVRQIVGESVVQGVLGGLLGAAIGIGGAYLATKIAPTLQATAPPSSVGGVFGLGQVSAGVTGDTIALPAPIHISVLALALGLAVLGGLIAGAIGALRAARLRPADALRELG